MGDSLVAILTSKTCMARVPLVLSKHVFACIGQTYHQIVLRYSFICCQIKSVIDKPSIRQFATNNLSYMYIWIKTQKHYIYQNSCL